MSEINRESAVRRFAIAICASMVLAVTVQPVRADHVEQGLGAVIGGVVGGVLGSGIGSGSGQKVAIGVGSALGALYGNEVAKHGGYYSRPRAHYHRSRHAAPPAEVKYYPQPVPVYVQPTPVYVTPPAGTAQTSITVSTSGGSNISANPPASLTECRLLEGGLAPVYGCRDTHGGWRILR